MAIEGREPNLEIAGDADTARAGELAIEAMVRTGMIDPDSTELFTPTEQARYDRLLTMFLGEITAGPAQGA